jgi:hypothetical protein
MLIFKGENINTNWVSHHIPSNWRISCNSKGWSCNDLGLKYLVEVFEPATREKANGRKRLLICDGHDSHISAQFVRHCIDHNIELLLLLPHSSHLM